MVPLPSGPNARRDKLHAASHPGYLTHLDDPNLLWREVTDTGKARHARWRQELDLGALSRMAAKLIDVPMLAVTVAAKPVIQRPINFAFPPILDWQVCGLPQTVDRPTLNNRANRSPSGPRSSVKSEQTGRMQPPPAKDRHGGKDTFGRKLPHTRVWRI